MRPGLGDVVLRLLVSSWEMDVRSTVTPLPVVLLVQDRAHVVDHKNGGDLPDLARSQPSSELVDADVGNLPGQRLRIWLLSPS